MTAPCLVLVPVTLRQARAFVGEHHRHSDPPRAWRFGVGVALDGVLVGVGVAARPCRKLDDGYTLAITRTCTVGTPNACSMIYGGLVRAGRALGYLRFRTYTKLDEPGTSLRAAGWVIDHDVAPQNWDRPSRARKAKPIDTEPKVCWRWEVAA